ncbi:gamma-glutamyltransferase family protein [Paracoccus sulfuroxidans]|uniref:Gamma-glutamyltransferase 2 n=1 Tax=Paracoccus sulfuroxidans TaxID=384678 RepID=A0A562NSR3_9RHOB|nr:gamma-glutamyltransferase family protein [Paracoccus sulfuroxidans]TWI35258.1 gamma-glutamyltransferase 2 [Paracoccus sulfuroxidans]
MTEFDFLSGRRPSTYGTGGMVATSHALASSAGLAILAQGGNAVDAAIAASAVQCVVDPHMTGIGGDCFVLYAPKDGPVRALNGSGRAPAGATLAALSARGVTALEQTSVHAITIPGAVSAWCRLHADHGRLPLSDVLAAAIHYAEDGFAISTRVAADFANYANDLRGDVHAAAMFLPGDQLPTPGDILRQPELAQRFREVGERGAAAFYQGENAAKMARHLQSLGGLHTEKDFHDATDGADWQEPISASYRGHELLECGPNGQGLAALLILKILEGFDMGPEVPLANRVHLQAEATKLAYHHRDALIADPAHCEGLAERLLSDDAIATLRARIRMDRATPPTLWDEPEHKDTIYLCVVDGEGNAVSFINSIFHAFGSTRLCPETGVLFHSRGASFRLIEGHPNCIAPGKRPMHTIIPGILRGEGRIMPFGVMGGHYQAAGQAAFVSAVVDRGMDLQAAMDEPRSFAFDGELQVERTMPEEVVQDLAARGHKIKRLPRPMGGSQAIRLDLATGLRTGASDSRKDGMAIGF